MAYDAVRPMEVHGGDVQPRSMLRRVAATCAVVSAVVAITMLVAASGGRQQVSAAGTVYGKPCDVAQRRQQIVPAGRRRQPLHSSTVATVSAPAAAAQGDAQAPWN